MPGLSLSIGLGLAAIGGGAAPGWVLRDENNTPALLQFSPGQYWYDREEYASFDELLTAVGGTNTLTVSANGTLVNSSGTRVQATANVLRLDHESDGTEIGWLMEGGATNRFLNSAAPVAQSVTPGGAFASVSMLGSGQLDITGAWTGTATEAASAHNVSSSAITVTPTGTVTHAQVEASDSTGRTSTSPIPTAGAAVTRGADILRLKGTGAPFAGFNASAGTVVLHARRAPREATTVQSLMSIDDETTGNVINVYCSASSAAMGAGVTAGGVAQAAIFIGSVNPSIDFAVAMAWAANDISVSLNGSAALSDTSASIPAVTRLAFAQAAGGLNPWNGHLKLFAYFPRRVAALASRPFFSSFPDRVYALGDSFANTTWQAELQTLLGDTLLGADAVGGSTLEAQLARFQATPAYHNQILISNDQLTLEQPIATTMATYAELFALLGHNRFLIMEPTFPNGGGFYLGYEARNDIWAEIVATYPNNVAYATDLMVAAGTGSDQDNAFIAAGSWPASVLADPGVTNDPVDVVDGHLNATGNQIYAQAAYNALVAKGWV